MKDSFENQKTNSKTTLTPNNNKFSEEYSVIERIGILSFGRVFRVKHLKSGLERAVTVVEFSREDEQMEKLSVWSKLNHSNIPKFHEYFIENEVFFIVTDSVEGKDLFEQCQNKFSESKIAKIIYQLLDTVNYLHKEGFFHGNLKLDNLILGGTEENPKIYLCDFSAITKFEEGTSLTSEIEPSSFLAPEVLNRSYSCESDIWSCGAILYFLFCNRAPFMGSSPDEIDDNIKNAPVTFESEAWNSVRTEAIELIEQMLAKDPKQRIKADKALRNEWILFFQTKEVIEGVQKMNLTNTDIKLKEEFSSLIGAISEIKEENAKLTAIFEEADHRKNRIISIKFMREETKKMWESRMSEDEIEVLDDILFGCSEASTDYQEVLRNKIDFEMRDHDLSFEKCFESFNTDGSGYEKPSEIVRILKEITDPKAKDAAARLIDILGELEEYISAIQLISIIKNIA